MTVSNKQIQWPPNPQSAHKPKEIATEISVSMEEQEFQKENIQQPFLREWMKFAAQRG